jgi:hypothetical protein
MPIVNRFSGFTLATPTDYTTVDKDSEFGENLNRDINSLNSGTASITNSYLPNHINRFGASSNYSMNEQRFVQSMITESININGITVRFMPRYATHQDEIWNEAPESIFDRGYLMDVYLESAEGFEGEGDIMSQYGIEFREEITLRLSIPKFEELQLTYQNALVDSKFKRRRPLEGDLIVVPFGRTSQNRNQYVPKIFEIMRVTTYHDGAFFQLGDNYQYKLKCRLFELSGEELGFAPKVVQYDLDGNSKVIVDSDVGPIAESREGITDSEVCIVNFDSEVIHDPWGDNVELEARSRDQTATDLQGNKLKEKARVTTLDYTAQAFGYNSILESLDDL